MVEKIHVCVSVCVAAKGKNVGERNGEIKGKRKIVGMSETEIQGDGRGHKVNDKEGS